MPARTGNKNKNSTVSAAVGDLHVSTRPLVALPASRATRRDRARRVRLALLATRIATDMVLLLASFALAYWLRYVLALGRDVIGPESYLPFSRFYPYMAAYVLITLLTFQLRGLYALPRGAAWSEHVRIIATAVTIGVAALTLGALVLNPVLPSRLLFLFLWLGTIVVFAVERFVYRQFRMWLWRRGINIRRAIVVGAGLAGQRIMKDVLERPELGYELVGYVAESADIPASPGWRVPIRIRPRKLNGAADGPGGDDKVHLRNTGGLHRLGTLKDVHRIITQTNPSEVIVALPANHHAQILGIIDSCRESGVDFKLVPDLFEMRFNEVSIDALNGVPLIGVKDVALQGFNLFVKRLLDAVLAVLALVVASPVLLITALLIKATSPGPIIFRQVRVGKGGREFTCYKFRTMHKGAEEKLEELRHLNEADGPIFKMRDDPRRTPFGKFLRRTSLDELPQLINIVKGEMSFVGPRPPTPSEVEKYSDWHRKRLDVTPGLTGLWQVSGRSELTFDEMVKLDIYYAENWSLGVDLMIILKTIPAVLKSEGAY